MEPLELTVVLFAVPPESMYMEPPELTVVLFAVPPEEMYIATPFKWIPELITPLEI